MYDQIIRRTDENMNTKASRIELYELEQKVQTKVSKEELKDDDNAMEAKIDGFKREIADMKKVLETLQSDFSVGVYEAVKKANKQI